MKAKLRFLNLVVAAHAALFGVALPAAAQDTAQATADAPAVTPETADSYLDRLKTADEGEAARIETELVILWSKSGSPALDMLYRRATDALAAGDSRTAVEHLTAAIDQDPGFTAAYDARAAAYYLSGEVGPALADMAHVLTVEPRQFSTLSGLGGILEETGHTAKALAAYRAAAAIHPHMAEVNDAIARLSKDLEGQEL